MNHFLTYLGRRLKPLVLLCFLIFGAIGLYAQKAVVEFDNPGSDTWTTPSEVTEITIEIWGSGGAGTAGNGLNGVGINGGNGGSEDGESGDSGTVTAGGSGSSGVQPDGGRASGGSGGVGGDGLFTVTYTTDLCASFALTKGDLINPLCFEGADGTVSVVVTGGKSPYSFSWEDDLMFTDSVRTELTAGSYKVFVEDANECIKELTFNLSDPAEITIALEELSGESCPGDSDGSIEVSASGGNGSLSFLWSNNETTAEITGLTAATYFLTVTDINSCEATASYTVNVVDNIPPSVNCRNINADLDGDGMVTIQPEDVFESGTDNCGTVNLESVFPNSFDCSDIGIQKVTLTVNDGNGNTNTCMADVNVRDVTPPVFECQDITVSLNANGEFSISSANYVINKIQTNFKDNCASGPQAFSISSNGWNCDHIGPNSTTIIARDGNGNETPCTITITLTNDLGACAEHIVSGTIRWSSDQNETVNLVDVYATGDGLDLDQTGTNGAFVLKLPQGGDYTITPFKSTEVLNGSDIADVQAIQQHLTFINRFTDPFQLIAADVSGDGTISSDDALIIAQTLIRNPTSEGLFVSSWRFVPADYVFPDPLNPWGFPESIDLVDLQTDITDADFIAVKIGDVTGDADPSDLLPQNPPRNLREKLVWQVSDKQWDAAGEMIEVQFRNGYFRDFSCWQMGLQFDHSALEFVEVLTEDSDLNMGSNNFGSFNADEGELRAVWYHSSGLNRDIEEGKEVFTYVFRSLTNGGKISNHLWLEDAVLPARVYDQDFQLSGIDLEFMEEGTVSVFDPSTANFRLLQNRPNPFQNVTTIGFEIPEAAAVQLRIRDISGRLVDRVGGDFGSGYNEFRIEGNFPTGLYFYELVTPFGVLVGQMVVSTPLNDH